MENGSFNTNQLRHHLCDGDFWKHFDHCDVRGGEAVAKEVIQRVNNVSGDI